MDRQRRRIPEIDELDQMLAAAQETEWRQRAYSSEQVHDVTARLQALEGDDIESRLRIAGFSREPYKSGADNDISQACETCMYYEVNRRFCVLPELMLPVRPKWSCVLWRI